MKFLDQVILVSKIRKEYETKMQEYSKQLEIELNEKYKKDIENENDFVFKVPGIKIPFKTKIKFGGKR